MFFKLSIKNIRKSVKDYAIYFATLILGVAIFYIFNALDSQQIMDAMDSSSYEMVRALVIMVSYLSVFVAFILGFLIVYANNFLIKRRKQEFGIYMTLGMGKGQISRILLGETLIVGVLSLGVGLLAGVFGSQFMSLLVVRMFEGAMDEYQFVFSETAFFKTILYFGIMFLIMAVFNLVSLSRYQLIDLLSARKKSEKVKMKNPVLCMVVFLFAAGVLGFLYYKVAYPMEIKINEIGWIILAGSAATFLVFWSLSGFLLYLFQHRKKYYLRDLNAFILRQLHSKINTTVFAMTMICLMLFMTISVLSGGLGLNFSFRNSLSEQTPVDVTVYNSAHTDVNINGDKSILEQLEQQGLDRNYFKDDYVEATVYAKEDFTIGDGMGMGEALELENGAVIYMGGFLQDIMKESEYNRIARIYGKETVEVPEGTYAVICDYDAIRVMRNKRLEKGQVLELDGKEYVPAYNKCMDGFLYLNTTASNMGIYVLPDEEVKEAWADEHFLAANYNTDIADKAEIEEAVMNAVGNAEGTFVSSKIEITAFSGGFSVMITFVAIYLGIVFLISGAAILALKELSESSDNRERYDMLRKLGADEKMINQALFRQIAVFFFLPLLVAVIHSVFGLVFVRGLLSEFGEMDSFQSILWAAGVIVLIYGGYFLITYLGGKQIIRSR